MDPRNPYSQSVGYTGLLYSQHESVNDGNSPYESFPSGSSQIPQFSSQQSVAPTPPTDPPVERGRRHKWTPVEDEMLISAWLNTSKDAIVGNNSDMERFSVNMPSPVGNTMDRRTSVRNIQTHHNLKYDLIENIWVKFRLHPDNM